MACKHEYVGQTVLRVVGFRLLVCGLFELFDPVGIAKGVESVFAAALGRGDIGDHQGFAIACERVLENEGELAAAERGVLLVLIKCSNAFLKG